MPRQTIQVLPTDRIELDEDWGVANGIKINDLRITLIGPKVVGKMLACLQDLQRELDDRDAREAGELTEAESLTRYTDEDAVFDRQRADRDMEDRAEAGI